MADLVEKDAEKNGIKPMMDRLGSECRPMGGGEKHVHESVGGHWRRFTREA